MWLLVAVAQAAEPRQALEDAMLARALGDHETARARLLLLTNSLAAEDPVRGWALYWLATIQLDWGDAARARDSLRECIRTGPAREVCEDLLGRVQLDEQAMRTVPTVWTFADDHGVVLPGDGRLVVEDEALVWAHPRDPSLPGTLLFGVDLPAGTPVSRLDLTATARDADAWLGVVFVDERGGVFPAAEGVRRVPADQPTVLTARLAPGPTGLDPSGIERVLIRDMTAVHDAAADGGVIVLDDLALR
jgi:hypothetical protein